jgi:hypothetical protein
MKVFSFQSKEVLKTLKKTGSYTPDPTKHRERRDYTPDIEQLDGQLPIWCFTPVHYVIDKDASGDVFVKEMFLSGSLFFEYKCQMSLGENGLSEFVMLELEVPDEELKLGLTHNAYSGSQVFSKLALDRLVAVYRLDYSGHWYLPSVKTLEVHREGGLFPRDFKCVKIKK